MLAGLNTSPKTYCFFPIDGIFRITLEANYATGGRCAMG
jgi:hypothetical protein